MYYNSITKHTKHIKLVTINKTISIEKNKTQCTIVTINEAR